MGNILDLRVRKCYAGFNLSVSASVPSGIVAIFGPSGSGKTSLLNCISGLVSPDEGEISLRGQILFSSSQGINLPPEQRRIGYMFQESLLFPHLKVRDNILYGYNLTSPSIRRIDPSQLVTLLELDPLMDRRPENISVGERQRVVLARALATSPNLLLLDEPLASLHMGIKGRILRYLKAVHRDLSIPMLYVSHSMSEVLAIADKAIILDNGRQIAFDEPRKTLRDLGTTPTMESVSLENLLDVEIMEHRRSNGVSLGMVDGTTLILPYVDEKVGTRISISVPAAGIILAVRRPEGISARNVLEARIEGIHALGTGILVYARINELWLVEITPDALTDLDLYEGQKVYLVIKSSSIIPLH